VKNILSILIFMSILFYLNSARAQTSQTLSSLRSQLTRIEKEIDRLQSQLEQTEKQLHSEMAVAQNLDQQITLLKKSVLLLNQQIRKNKAIIEHLMGQIDSITSQIQKLTDVFARQIRFAYKYHRGSTLAWILGSTSWHQAYMRIQYFQKISRSARAVFERLKQKKRERKILKSQYEKKLAEQERMLVEKTAKEKELEQKLALRQKNIQKIHRNHTLLTQALNDKKQSYRQLQQMISQLERERSRRSFRPETQKRWEGIAGNFAKQKGKLNWPVKGTILHPFGQYRNPQLNTTMVNPGIDIRAPKGAPVRCVFPGVVIRITYLRGFGNTIIVDHNNSYYTVYSHLDEIYVRPFQFLEAGDLIGTVGESGSLEGPMLHFEIYGRSQPLNPRQWLK